MRVINRCFRLCVALVILSSAIESWAFTGDAMLIEDFEDQSAEGWKTKSSLNWKIENDNGDYAFHQWNTNVGGADEFVNEWAIYDREEYDNMSFSVLARSAENLSANPKADFALIFHYQNDDNFYLVSFNAEENETALVLRKNGRNTVLARCSSPIIKNTSYFSVAVSTLNGEITVSTHELTIFKFYDATFLSGKIGVGVKDDAAYFDDVIVCEKEEPECDVVYDFNDKSLNGWTAWDDDNWALSLKDYSIVLYLTSTRHTAPSANRLGEVITIDNINAENFTFECDLKSIEWENPTADLGVVFCYIDDENYYAVIFRRDSGETEFVRIKNNQEVTLDQYAGATLSDLEWHHVKVTAHGNYYKIFFDGNLILEQYDSYLTAGKVGVGSQNDSGYFDNICISGENGENIIKEELLVTSPNGGETLQAGEVHSISWLADGVSNNVMLQYSTDGGGVWNTIISSTPNDNLFDWTVPEVNSNNCLIRIQDIDNSPVDDSDAPFTINPASRITVAAPNGGEDLQSGANYNIRWNSQNTSGNVKIEFTSDGGGSWQSVNSNTLDDGIFTWLVPSVVSNRCKIRISDVGGSATDMSDGWFSIHEPPKTLTVISPNGGEQWVMGDVRELRWQSNAGGAVKIELIKAGALELSIAANTPNDGSYSWTIPNTLIESDMYRIQITSLSYAEAADYSDHYFTILAPETITITSPNGGEQWLANSQHNITWTHNRAGSRVKIEYTTDGTSWAKIAANAPNNGVYAWTLPNVNSTLCQVRITDTDGSPSDVSDAPFTIYKEEDQPPIQPMTAALECAPGADIWVDVMVGDADKPVDDLFGVSFTLQFNADDVRVIEPFSASVVPGDLLGSDLIFYQTVDNTAGKVSAGLSRKAGVGGVDGFGSVLRVHFHVNEAAVEGQNIVFTVSDVSANNSGGAAIELTPKPLTLVVKTGVVVWPGDADNNGIVDQADILPLGLYWGKTGAKRLNASILWSAQICPQPWAPEKAVYADCNGDGVVNQGEVPAIGLNWGKTHSAQKVQAQGELNKSANSSNMELLCLGDGTENAPYYILAKVINVVDLLGISFEIRAVENGQYVEFTTVVYDSFFGQESQIVHFENINNDSAIVGIGASRKAEEGGVDGTGGICRIYFRLKENTPDGQVIKFAAFDTSANNSAGEPIDIQVLPTQMTTGVENFAVRPSTFALHQNYPNPFNPSTVIEYDAPRPMHVTMTIFNTLGQKIKTLVDGEIAAGRHSVVWNGTNDDGLGVSPGIYLCRLSGPDQSKLIKIVFAK